MHVSIIKHKHPLELLCTKYCLAVLLKWTNWKFIFPWRKLATNWHVLQIAKVHFRYTIWLKYYEVHVSSLWWCMHVQKVKVSTNKAYKKIVCQNFQYFQPLKITLMCTCGFYNRYEHVWRNSKTFLEENCAVALDSCYLFTKKMLNMELNMILHRYITFISELYSRFDEYLAWYMVNLTVC